MIKQEQMSLMKIEVKLAYDLFSKGKKKVTIGIKKLYQDILLSNDPKQIEKDYKRFFGYIQTSKRAGEKWKT